MGEIRVAAICERRSHGRPEGKRGPLMFVGQIDIEPRGALNIHDSTVFYVFYEDQSGETEVVVQQA